MPHRGFRKILRREFICGVLLVLAPGVTPAAEPANTNTVTVLEVENQVEFRPAGQQDWYKAYTNLVLKAGDRGRTSTNSRAILRLHDSTVVRVGPETEFEIDRPAAASKSPLLNLWRGLTYYFSRDKPMEGGVRTPAASAAIRGTEFVLRHDEQGGTVLTLFDGEVLLSDLAGQSVTLKSLEEGIVRPGQPPAKTAVIDAANAIQWCLYYPGVLDVGELQLNHQEEEDLAEASAAYRSGDLLQALASYPAGRQPASDSEQVFLGALLLAVGEVEAAEARLAPILRSGGQDERLARLASALRKMIAAVKGPPRQTPDGAERSPNLATEWLAESYWLQAQARLAEAAEAARKAVEISPDFGFGWARVAELEFSFGRTGEALRALETGLKLSPRNAQAVALQGFVLSAQNRVSAARRCFDQAIALDGALGNAWLGRGLCKIRIGDSLGGLKDLEIAAALEPNRSLSRSYLGKAYTAVDDYPRASKELKRAINLDPQDPTGWLYSALLKQQQNQINQAIGDLEASQRLNDNRSLFRSRLLLDQDRAVSSANLASIYRDAGMTDVSVREASRAVTYDYANPAAHLFLSDSYNELRDPTRFNLRYETIWFNELLLANLLAPVGGGRLAQHVSQQEYSQLFQADGFGLANSTLGRSDNKSITELVSQYGTFGGTSYALDLDYQHSDGVRPNNGLDRIEWFSTVKQQVTPHDTLLAQVKYEDYSSGDNFQYYYQTNARRNFQFTEYQQPILVGGWHHEWSPGAHTLLLGGRIVTDQNFSDRGAKQLILGEDSTGAINAVAALPLNANYHGDVEIYLAELNQIFQWDRVTLSLGGRWQGGSFQTQAEFTDPPPGLASLFNEPVAKGSLDEDFNRLTGYGYLTLEPLDHLWLIGGAAYDNITYPANFRNPPLSAGEAQKSQLGPKAGLVWNPVSLFTFRGAYTRSLGGVSEDENYRLEQTQVAGFPQTFRSLIPESVGGSVCAPEFETYAVALDLKFSSRTYVGVQAQQLNSDVNRTVGCLVLSNGLPPFVPTSTPEQLRYRETSIGVNINQLLGDFFVVGVGYTFNQAELHDAYPEVSVKGSKTTQQADLHLTHGYLLFNHPSGFFARADATWYHQENSGYTPALAGDDFVQENIYLGYRFLHRHAEVMFGILNLSDQDYHLNPLSTYLELPRERTFILRVSFIF